jgi:PBP1b-binding outer membrane lipoprotein LpoB
MQNIMATIMLTLVLAGCSSMGAAPTTASLAPPAAANTAPAAKVASNKMPDGATDRDCTPMNGRDGFYGNIWCQPDGYKP